MMRIPTVANGFLPVKRSMAGKAGDATAMAGLLRTMACQAVEF